MDNKRLNQEFDSSNIFLFFIRWWKHLLIIAFVAGVLSVIFSSPWFITPKYESTVSMFPAKSQSLSKAVMVNHEDFLEYGDVDDAERLIEVLGSSNVRERVVRRFNLLDHYEIDKNDKQKDFHLRNIYNSNVNINRTTYGAVEVTVRDNDPQMAADMANEIAALGDTIKNEIRAERATIAYNMAKGRRDIVLTELMQTRDTLRKIMKTGVEAQENQAEMLYRQLAKDLSAHNIAGVQAIEERLESIREGGAGFISQKGRLETASGALISAELLLQMTEADKNSFIPYKYLIDEAVPSFKKAYPVRWLIVFLSVFASGFMGVVVIMAYENMQKKGIIGSR